MTAAADRQPLPARQTTPAPEIFMTLLERLQTRLDELDSLGAAINEYLGSRP